MAFIPMPRTKQEYARLSDYRKAAKPLELQLRKEQNPIKHAELIKSLEALRTHYRLRFTAHGTVFY